VAVLVGSEVVYLPGQGVSAVTMTPYDVCAVRLDDGLVLAGTPARDAERYLAAFRMERGAHAVARTAAGLVIGTDLTTLVERLAGIAWADAERQTRAAGALVGAYPADG
jgi:hypothetical protein